MSREQYEVPTSSASVFNQAGSGAAASAQGESADSGTGTAVTYLCGDCNTKVSLKRGDPVRCKECGHRVLYKERTKRMVQFRAV